MPKAKKNKGKELNDRVENADAEGRVRVLFWKILVISPA
jgi:hypothetical protein